MNILECPNCATTVVPRADGNCPSCRHSLVRSAESQSPDAVAASVTDASAESGLLKQSEAARQVLTVVRVLLYIGWPLSLLLVPYLIFSMPVVGIMAMSDPKAPLGAIIIGFFGLVLLAVFSVFHIVVANRLRFRKPGAMRAAIALCCIMMLGFPLFTIIGASCLRKIRVFYPIYLHEVPGTSA